MILALAAVLEGIPRNLEEAAGNLGTGWCCRRRCPASLRAACWCPSSA
ncbi:hypothetical protein ACFQU2_14635 [Siccirubricoccus deserti]|uniref:Uncharacterized protein n=1 Tax=Siccirubricoccus deserti TaxID=2013562 RepID=A0A9X0R1C8_9PROT|nr:hypothetical protein [Siccirubricoccus deserti]MBC4017505.1 hypothetical protein [Siccirubricoccus deserti]